MDKVVNNDDVLQASILYHSQIFDPEAVTCFQTVASWEYALNCLFLHVKELDYWSRIVFGGSCEYINLEVIIHFFQKFETIRSDVEFDSVFALVDHDIRAFLIKNGMNESLIKVKHQKF